MTDSLENWARYVKRNKNWKREHTKFINAQFQKHKEILKNSQKKR